MKVLVSPTLSKSEIRAVLMRARGSFKRTVRHKLDGALDDDFVERVNRALKNYVAATLIHQNRVNPSTQEKVLKRLAKIANGTDVRLGSRLGELIEEAISRASISYPDASRSELAAQALRRMEYQSKMSPPRDLPPHEGDTRRIEMVRSINVAWLLSFDFPPALSKNPVGYCAFLQALFSAYAQKLKSEFGLPKARLLKLANSSGALEGVFKNASTSMSSGKEWYLKTLINDLEELFSGAK